MKHIGIAIVLVLALYSVPLGHRAQSTDTFLLASHEISLDKRYENAFVNRVFKENILLTLAYARHSVAPQKPINWSVVDTPFRWTFTLNPHKTMVYHDAILDTYQASATVLTHAHFNSQEGFLSDGYLVGDGTCHLASLLAWVAKDAGLFVDAPTNHDFASIPQVPKEYGVSIYSHPHNKTTSQLQNIYIQNNRAIPVQFVFDYDGHDLKISALEVF